MGIKPIDPLNPTPIKWIQGHLWERLELLWLNQTLKFVNDNFKVRHCWLKSLHMLGIASHAYAIVNIPYEFHNCVNNLLYFMKGGIELCRLMILVIIQIGMLAYWRALMHYGVQ